MSNSNNNQINIPQAREAMDRFKMLICPGGWREPVERLQRPPDLPRGRLRRRPYVKKMCPVRNMKFERNNRIAVGHVETVQYITSVTV